MLSQTSFDIQPTVRTSFGLGATKKLGRRLKGMGAPAAFVVTDAGLVAAGIVARLTGALEADGVAVEVFDGVTPNPDVPCVEAGAEQLRRHPGSVVLALGGGSVLDASKAIALLAPNRGAARDFGFGCKPDAPGHRVVAVPTTAGTGSETNMFGVVTDPTIGRKVLLAHPSVLPVHIVLDPELTIGVPKLVTATTGMDVLTHSIEACSSSRANPYSDALALQAIGMVARHLARACADGGDLEARAQMLLAANLAGLAFGSSGLGICHAMGHPLSARLNAAHGQTLSTLLPHVMEFNAGTVASKYALVAQAMGAAEPGASDEGNAARAIAAVRALSAEVGTDRPARELGLQEALIPTLVDDAFADLLMMTTPKYPERSDVERLYRLAL
jgi:alcohol dehydrogenase